MYTVPDAEAAANAARGRISIVFGEYKQGIAIVVLDSGQVLHIHDPILIEKLEQVFGSPASASGKAIAYQADRLGIVQDFCAT